jgi:nitronate monooxygenase
MWTRTGLTALLGTELPIVQGPLGGGTSTPALAAAVSNAGALGSLGAVGFTPDEIRAGVRDIRSRTAKPFNVNLWVPIAGEDDVVPSPERRERALAHLRPFLRELGLADPAAARAVPFEEQVEALLDAHPPVFSFVMGVPAASVFAAARARGIRTIGTATTVEEALAIEAAGADAVVASGSDAGGHRGSFLRSSEESLVGTLSLVPQVASAVRIPVIAAGGIADGRGIAAALALGAAGVQLGTAFVVAAESGAAAAHRAALGRPEARFTRLTRAVTGRSARGLDTALIRALEPYATDALRYPHQHVLTLGLRKAAAKLGRDDLLALWAGQNAATVRALPAAELVRVLVRETDAVLRDGRLRPCEA